MSLRGSRAARAERQQAESMAREIDWPLPLKGLLSQAATSELNGRLADTLDNWRSNGLALEMRDGYAVTDSEAALQRIPFEFGSSTGYIKILSSVAKFGGITYARAFTEDVMHASISSNVLMADGLGPIFRFNGTAFSEAGFTTSDSKDPDEFNGIFSHKDRVYAWDTDGELAFYYGAVGAITGTLTKFPLANLGNITGKITLMASITVNAAQGMSDLLLIMTSTGVMLLYEGLDPGDATSWSLFGRLKVAPPVSRFAVASFGSDVWVLTTRGIASVKESLQAGVTALVQSQAKVIADDLVADVKAGKAFDGWQMLTRDDGQQFILNVPTSATTFKQYVFEADVDAWSTADYPARWWHSLDSFTDFTDDQGQNCRVSDGGDDDGDDITATFHTSWVRLPRASEICYLIPTIIAEGALSVTITVLSDHDDTPGDITQAAQTVTISPDNEGDAVALNELIGVNVSGRVFQARFTVTGRNVSFENLIAGVA